MPSLATTRRPRLLVSGRDPSTAIAFEHVIKENSRSQAFEIRGLASGVAFFRLSSLLGPQHLIEVSSPTHEEAATKLIHQLFDDWRPDLCLAGVSGPDHGIDEIMVREAKAQGISSFVFQSYWGDLNPLTIPFLNKILVIDQFAADVTASKCAAEIFVVGSPQYDSLGDLKPQQHRQAFNSAIRRSPAQPVIAIMGQPLEDYTGYFPTFEMFASAVKVLNPLIFLRNHPKETDNSKARTRAVFNECGLSVIESSELLLEDILCGADLVATPFSTSCFDLQMINRVSEFPLASACYMMFNPDLAETFRHLSGLRSIPNSDHSVATCLTDPSTILEDVQHALAPTVQQARWQTIRRTFVMPGGGARRILSTLHQHLSSR